MPLPVPALLRTLFAILVAAATFVAVPVASAGTISGAMFEDADRDGVKDAGESPIANQLVYLTDPAGTRALAYTGTDTAGNYSFANVADGSYRVEMDYARWCELRQDWVPTTTQGLFPRHSVNLVGTATAHFGLRRIVRSAAGGAPQSTYTGPTGLRTESYNDAFTARQVHDVLAGGSLIGEEASKIRVRFDYGNTSVAYTGISGGPGSYSNFSADIRITWIGYLEQGDRLLFHEYGHAWAYHYLYLAKQNTSLDAYLKARGIALDDPRLDSNHDWSRDELIAEDYRQLFGNAGTTADQENTDIPPAAQVPGLRDYLMTTFRQPVQSEPAPEPTPAPTPAPAPAPAVTVTNLVMNPTAVKSSGTASFTLSTAATVTVTIRDGKGSVVKTLLANAAKSGGGVSAVWDRTNTNGARVKGGTYSVVAEATDSGGRKATASTTFKVS